MTPDSQGGFVRRAAPEPNKRALYVGGLDPRVTEDVLRQIFETTGHVQNVKIIPDKNVGAVSLILYFSLPVPCSDPYQCTMLIALPSYSPRASTTDSSSTMTQERPSARCRP